ncbi:MAG: sulfur carrier protein ThiS [Planctomycetes bacterium]|nr:sulfur carrier protein ThiS [Planctomycetota bacterium]
MNVRVNGEQRVLASACTVARLLDELNLAGQPCAVEVNAAIVPRREHGERLLSDGDTVEIVTLVGGG